MYHLLVKTIDVCSLCLCWLSFLLASNTVSAQDNLLSIFAKDQKFSDIAHISIQKANSCKLKPCRKLWLTNAGRASIYLGDFSGAKYFFNLSDSREKMTVSDLKLLAYTTILMSDWSEYSSLTTRIGNYSEAEEKKIHLLKSIYGPDRNTPNRIARVATQLISITQITPDSLPEKYVSLKTKSPMVAGVLSAIVPGAGHAYLGMWQSAFISFFLVSISALTISEQIHHKQPITAVAAALVGSVFYMGGVLSAARSANELNDRKFSSIRNEIREQALPELGFTWTLQLSH